MSEDQNMSAEDLDVEASEAESVAGGRANVDAGDQRAYDIESEIAGLQAKGYVEESCTAEGTLMVNPHTRHKKLVR